jgi:allantoicase
MTDFRKLPDLASERFGGRVIAANDEFFGPKEFLLKESKPVFIEGKYDDRGKWMDGWETRRRRTPGYDWCIVRLGLAGIIRGVVVDTSFFTGNFPEEFSIETCAIAAQSSLKRELAALNSRATKWHELLPETGLKGDSQNPFELMNERRCTHLRFKIYPDGGVARLRVHGEVVPATLHDAKRARGKSGELDLAAIENGGRILAASDEFYGVPLHLLLPGRSRGMSDGWETQRRRGPGNDWTVIQLGIAGVVRRIEVDTSFFRGNYPESCSVDFCRLPRGAAPNEKTEWKALFPRTKLRADTRHVFRKEILSGETASHLRFNIFPDGGVSRLRIWGVPSGESSPAGMAWVDSAAEKQVGAALLDCCGSNEWVKQMLARRPFGDAEELFGAADEIWAGLKGTDWLDAFRRHPRIGEKKAARKQSKKAGAWSAAEQADVVAAGADTKEVLAAALRGYEAAFGFIFIICAAGKTPEEILKNLQQRMGNDRETELRVAAEEQRKITRLRLEKLIAS